MKQQPQANMYRSRLPTPSLLCLVVLLLPSFCSANFLSEPTVRWTFQLDGSSGQSGDRGLRQGNAVVVHPDGSKLIVTAEDGSLHILQTGTSVETLAVFEPEPLDGRFVECRSGPSIVQPSTADDAATTGGTDDDDFIVYAVIDTSAAPTVQGNEGGEAITMDNNDETDVSSRVIAVTMDGTLKWNVTVPGRIAGNPALGDSKTLLYVAHNDAGVGALSVILMDARRDSGVIVATLSSPATDTMNGNGPFGPAVVQSGGSSNAPGGDIVLVAESWGGGYSEEGGGLYMLSPVADSGNGGNATFLLRQISSWPFNAIAPPLVVGDSVFLGATSANLVAWTGNDRNDLSGVILGTRDNIDPFWVFQANTNQMNRTQPLLSTPALDSFETVLIVAGVDADLYAIDTQSGRDTWSILGRSQILARPQIWETDEVSVLYVVESLDGRVRQFDLYSGERLWGINCADINREDSEGGGFCQDSVEAEFAIAPSGNVIYYGDVFGRIVSLEVATFETAAPTISPTSLASSNPTQQPQSSAPTATPSTMPLKPVSEGGAAPIPTTPTPPDDTEDSTDTQTSSANSQEPEDQTERSSSYAVYIGAGVGAFCALLVPIVMFSLIRRNKQNQKNRDGIVVEVVEDCESDCESDDRETYGLNESTDTSSTDGTGIEVEFVGSRSVPKTPPRQSSHSKKKKRKKRKQLPHTSQSVGTLESIDELPEGVTRTGTPQKTKSSYQYTDEEDDTGVKVNLSQKFDLSAESERNNGIIEPDESGRVTPVARGGVGRASGSNHLELSVGNNNLAPVTSDGRLDYQGQFNSNAEYMGTGLIAQDLDRDSSDDETTPPPPPPRPSATNPQWSFYSLLHMSSSQPSKNKQTSSPAATPMPSKSVANAELSPPASSSSPIILGNQQEVIQTTSQSEEKRIKSLKQNGSNDPNAEKFSGSNATEKEYSVDHSVTSPHLVHQDPAIADLLPLSSTDRDYDEPDPRIPKALLSSQTPVDLQKADPSLRRSRASEDKVGEEKKENEDSGSPSPAFSNNSRHTPVSPSSQATTDSVFCPASPLNSAGPTEIARAMSRDSQSSRSIQSSRISVEDSPSNASTDDDSLYTSATGKTGEQRVDRADMSPLSSCIFDKEFERNVLPVDEALEALAQPNLGKKYVGGSALGQAKFQYPEDDDDAPDDEIVLAPGSQYMSKNMDSRNTQKYGRSVRSKKDPPLPQRGSRNENNASSGSYDSDNESPLAAIYSQLAALGQRKVEEKKHVYKRRSKKEEQEEQPNQEEEGDTWGSFLNELAEAEKQFFAPNAAQQASLLKFGDSQDSEDSEVARINDIL